MLSGMSPGGLLSGGTGDWAAVRERVGVGEVLVGTPGVMLVPAGGDAAVDDFEQAVEVSMIATTAAPPTSLSPDPNGVAASRRAPMRPYVPERR